MTENNQILQRAIKKAVKNGYRVGLPMADIMEVLERNVNVSPAVYYWIIFNHDFAKAIFGYEQIPMVISSNECTYETAWQYHLSKMVLKRYPLRYLEKFI